ncbi:glycosyltransferase family 4 protein [Fibrella sp. HMF5335]|uniref:Glycosyltransferase family 4 protein n=1 Tax=Fibrella rubiginis TaxID=2817060 RepID=A0A939K6Y8_9BACT|nr:glycosyltransferase family 4 protein [Fibrella rubiginis]MBO0938816.1 glycosyltransferase family 4 protein [Fibrella rubiginis]
MRILFVHNYYQQRGGEDAVFEQEVSLLRENGHTVETVEFTNAGFDGSLVGNLVGAAKSMYSNASARRMEQAIDAFQPDVVHIHNLFYSASPSVIRAAKGRGIPVVMTLHNYRLVCNSGMLSRADQVPCERCLTKTIPLAGIRHSCFRDSRVQSIQLTAITSLHKLSGIWKSVDRFIVLTDFAREKFLQSSLQLRPDQVVVKPNSIDELSYAHPEEREDFFLFVGRLSFEKGIRVLIEAARIGKFPIEIVGDGPFRPLVEQAAAELPNIRYVGKLPHNEGIERLKKCRAMILPSIWYEGLPTTILEAFATGTPVICSDQGNLNSIVTKGKTGHLFETGSATSLVSLINRLCPDQLNQHALAGFDVYRNKYEKQTVLERLISVYADLIPNAQPVVV